MGTGVLGRQCCPSVTRGTGVGTTKGGKGSTVRVVAEGQGLPSGVSVARAPPHERQWVEATLAPGRVPQRRGWPRTRPKALGAASAYDSQAIRQRLCRRGIKPTVPTVESRQRRRPTRGRPLKTGPSSRQRWKGERGFGWMDTYSRLVVRDERAVEPDHAFCLIALILWCINLILK
jgi:hypothetical protein